MNWGSLAFDPGSQTLYANNNSDVYLVELVPREHMNDRLPFLIRHSNRRFGTVFGHKKLVLSVVVVVLLMGYVARGRRDSGWIAGSIAVFRWRAFWWHGWRSARLWNWRKVR